MPSSATWDGQLSSSGVVDPWSPKPAVSGPPADVWGMAAPLAQSQLTMPSTANDPWSAAAAPVPTSQSLHHVILRVYYFMNVCILLLLCAIWVIGQLCPCRIVLNLQNHALYKFSLYCIEMHCA